MRKSGSGGEPGQIIATPSRWWDLLFFHLPALAWAGLCTWLLAVPGSSLGHHRGWIEGLEELGHGGLVFVLAWLVIRSLARPPFTAARPALTGFVVATAWAVLLEGVQELVPGRGWEAVDVVASAAGALLAALFRWLARGRIGGPAPRDG